MNNIEQIDNNDALKEDVKDPNEVLLKEMEQNEKMDIQSKDDKETPQEGEQKDIKEDMIDMTNPQKINGAYTDQKAFSTGDNGNTFEYEDTLKRAEDYKEAVKNKEENVDSAVKTVENTENELKDIEKKESGVKEETQEVPQEEEVSVAENPIPEGEEERVQIDVVDTDHKEQVLAFRREEDYIDSETAEKLNTLAA